MTRFLKMSLSVVVLMLVAVLVLTSCGKEVVPFDSSALEAEIEAAKDDAAEAQEYADATNAALREALAALQSVVIEKADAETLNAKIAELTAALEAAKASSANADAELYKALEALEEAMVTLDGVITEKDLLAVNAYSYAARFELALDYTAAEKYASIYEKWDDIAYAYAVADHTMLRATKVEDVDGARAAYDDVVYNCRSAVDVFADDVAAFEGNYGDAKKLFDKGLEVCNFGEAYAKLAANYYDGRNLINDALSIYVTKVNYELDKVAGRIVVYPTDKAFGESDLQALERLSGEVLPAAQAAIVAVDAICGTNVEIGEKSLANFVVVVERMDALVNATIPALGSEFKGAVATANQIKALYNETVLGGVDTFVVTADAVATVNEWFGIVESWKATYLVPAPSGDETATDRYEINYALISENEALLAKYLEKVDAEAEAYKASAHDFQILVSYFYDLPATAEALDNLVVGVVDATKITSDNAAKAAEMVAAINTWRATYPKMLPLIYSPAEKTPNASFAEAMEILDLFAAKGIAVETALEYTIGEANAAADGTKVVMVGTVKDIGTAWSEQYGNISVTIVNSEGEELYLYRLEANVGVGDVIKVSGEMATYKGARQLAAGATAEVLAKHVCVYTTYTAKCDECGLVKEHDCADTNADKECDGCGKPVVAIVGDSLAVFTFGENVTESPAHKDGSAMAEETASFTENEKSITFTAYENVYRDANDAKGNSALKLGTSKKTAKLEFTVGDEVKVVVIKVAQYKDYNSTVSVGGYDYELEGASNDGAYDTIVIDTSVNKTVTLETVAGAGRCMIDSIEYFG